MNMASGFVNGKSHAASLPKATLGRRDFLKAASFAAICGAASGSVGCLESGARRLGGEASQAAFDENLSIIFSDAHVCGEDVRAAKFTPKRMAAFVDEVLAMRPLPKRVIHLGDLAYLHGHPADYAVSKPMLKRLEDAGIELVFCMGNHDRRSNFLKHWPDYAQGQLVPGRFTRVVDLGGCDLVLLDTLKGADDRAENDMGPVEGAIDAAQLAWFEAFVAAARRPFFVGSHQFRDLYIDGEKPVSRAAKSAFFSGWIYGHDHSWCPDVSVASWKQHLIAPTLALPSTGLWGDIGYVLFRTEPSGAVAELRQSDFYFQTPTAHAVRPRQWDVRVQENRGKKMSFAFDRS